MIRAKEFIVNLYNKMFTDPEKEGENRRLVINQKTGELSWGKGKAPLGEGPDEKEIAESEGKEFRLEDNKSQATRMFEPLPGFEPYRKNRFMVDFPGIPPFFFQSYNYIGTDVHSKKRMFHSKEVIKDDYSSFNVLMLFPNAGIDICEKLKELEENPQVGEVKINLLDPTGVIVKTIVIPDCEVSEIKAFREFEYGKYNDQSDTLLMGEIIVKHKQRKLI